MAKMLLLSAEAATVAAVEAAMTSAGHGVLAMRTAAEIREEIKRQSYAMLFIDDHDAGDTGADIAVEAEQRGVRAIIMTKSPDRLDALRAKGLICFEQPRSPKALDAAIRARL